MTRLSSDDIDRVCQAAFWGSLSLHDRWNAAVTLRLAHCTRSCAPSLILAVAAAPTNERQVTDICAWPRHLPRHTSRPAAGEGLFSYLVSALDLDRIRQHAVIALTHICRYSHLLSDAVSPIRPCLVVNPDGRTACALGVPAATLQRK